MASVPDFNNFPRQGPKDSLSPVEAFQRRMARLKSGQIHPNVIWVGTDESYEMPARVYSARPSAARSLLQNAGYPVSMAAAVALGFCSHGVALVGRYYLQGLPNPKANPDVEMVAQIVIAFAIAMVVGYLIGLRSKELTPLKSLGAALGVLLFHNLVHMYPALFDALCSKVWVNYIVTHTKPHSLVWRGISFVF